MRKKDGKKSWVWRAFHLLKLMWERVTLEGNIYAEAEWWKQACWFCCWMLPSSSRLEKKIGPSARRIIGATRATTAVPPSIPGPAVIIHYLPTSNRERCSKDHWCVTGYYCCTSIYPRSCCPRPTPFTTIASTTEIVLQRRILSVKWLGFLSIATVKKHITLILLYSNMEEL